MIKREEIKRLTLYTGSNGKKGCACNCIGCSQERYGRSNPFYQGTKEQVKEMMELIPNVKDCIILGNPDPCIDPEFCNWVAKYLIQKGVRVRFSSSGFNAIRTIKILLKDLDVNYIDYMSYSIDTVDQELLNKLRGKKISLNEVNDAISYCLELNVRPKIQPTLWRINMEGYKELVEYYLERGVRWFSFHVGSMESFDVKKEELQHLSPKEWISIRNELMDMSIKRNFSIHMPYMYMTETEFENYKKERGDKCIPVQLRTTQIWLGNDQLRTTHCPLLREVRNFEYDLRTMDQKKIDFSISETGYCPAAKTCQGEENAARSLNGNSDEYIIDGERYYTICRSYNFNHNRPIIY